MFFRKLQKQRSFLFLLCLCVYTCLYVDIYVCVGYVLLGEVCAIFIKMKNVQEKHVKEEYNDWKRNHKKKRNWSHFCTINKQTP